MVIWFSDVAHWYTNFPNTSYDFQIVLHASGKIDLNYRNLIGDYDASIGIQQNSNVGSQVTFGTDVLSNNLNITFEKSPEWLTINPNSGTVMQGQTDIISLNVNSNNLIDATYNAFVNINSNGGSDSIPFVLTINGSVLGDANGDDLLNILDVIAIVNMILGQSDIDLSTSDLNQDGILNVLDITILLNLILSN